MIDDTQTRKEAPPDRQRQIEGRDCADDPCGTAPPVASGTDPRHCERSEAIQGCRARGWIAASARASQ
jgi:hypothetical protein